MKKFENQKGITLVVLIVTILIVLILTGITLNLSNNTTEISLEKKQLTEVNMVQNIILQQYTGYQTTKDDTYLVGTEISDLEWQTLITQINAQVEDKHLISIVDFPPNIENTEYRRLSKTDLESINIQESDYTYIVNYVSGEVLNETVLITESKIPIYTVSRTIFSNNDLEGAY